MKKAMAWMLVAGLFLSTAASAAYRGRVSGGADINTGMTGRLGIGFDSIPVGLSTGSSLISAPNAVSVRYWLNDQLGIEGLLALNINSQNSATTSTFGIGGGIKYNVKKIEDVLVQLLGHITIGIGSNPASGALPAYSSTTFTLTGGSGFEAFIPGWRALSVEGNVNVGFMFSGTNLPGSSSATSFGINGQGFSPINVAIHYYFN